MQGGMLDVSEKDDAGEAKKIPVKMFLEKKYLQGGMLKIFWGIQVSVWLDLWRGQGFTV